MSPHRLAAVIYGAIAGLWVGAALVVFVGCGGGGGGDRTNSNNPSNTTTTHACATTVNGIVQVCMDGATCSVVVPAPVADTTQRSGVAAKLNGTFVDFPWCSDSNTQAPDDHSSVTTDVPAEEVSTEAETL